MSERELINENMKAWAYFAPDGNIQVRSIALTKVLCREMIAQREWNDICKVSYKDYETAGFTIHRINFLAEVIK